MRLRALGLIPAAAIAMTTLGACGSSGSSSWNGGQSSSGSTSSSEASSANGASDTSASATTVAECKPAPPLPTDIPKDLKLPAKSTAEGKTFTAVLHTNCGDITLELDGAKAPQTVASFLQLSKKYWNDSPCHRLTTAGIYVLQCGDPTGSGSGTPGYGFGIENAPADGDYPTGTLAMARTSDPNSNGGQFFIVYADTQLPTDGGGYSIFGKVTSGLPLLEKIAKAGSDNSNGEGDGHPNQPISILSFSVTEKKA